MQNTHFYDIDAEKVGQIEDKNIVYSTKDNGVIVNKIASVANEKNNLLYALGNNMIFGLKSSSFFCENDKIKMIQKKTDEENYSTFLTFKDQTILELKSNGDIIIRKPNEKIRMITP